MLIDSHAHLAGERFATDRQDVLSRAWDAGLVHIVVIGDTSRDACALASGNARLSFTAGVHPHEAHTFDLDRDVAAIRELVAAGAVAIGECGLDYYYDHSPRDLQLAAFQAQIDLAAECGLPLVVHTRQAEDDTIRLMTRAGARGVQGVLHCFTGSPELAREALAAGWYISVSGIATFKSWDRDDVLATVPADRLLIETDAPYLAPVPHRGQRNESAFLPSTAARVAQVRGTTVEHIARVTAENAIRLFRLPVTL